MKYKSVTKITAIGTSGKAKGHEFIATPDSKGRYVLNRKVSKPSEGNKTNNAVNKVYTKTLTEAANLLATDDYLINLTSRFDSKTTRALRAFTKVVIHED